MLVCLFFLENSSPIDWPSKIKNTRFALELSSFIMYFFCFALQISCIIFFLSHLYLVFIFSAPIGQGYGLTETCAGGSFSDFDDTSVGRVGPPVPCSYIKVVID